MKTALLVEDRELAWLFLDPADAPEDAVPMDFSLAPGILFADAGDDEKVVWMASDTAIRVVPRDSVDFENDPFDKMWPIPSAEFCTSTAEYEQYMAGR